MKDSDFQIDRVLADLRDKCGDSQFGYRIQALFAHTVMRAGWTILEINAQGHPDILAQVDDREVLVQVKSTAHRSADSAVKLSSDDVAGIRAIGRRAGWFALLDCAAPVQWVVIQAERAASLLGKPLPLETLQANCDLALSARCTRHFYSLVSENHVRLPTLSYQILCHRALEHRQL